MALPYGTTGSLCSSFLPDRLVGLSVKRACAITLCGRLPIGLSAPLEASVTLLEATTPVKLPTKQISIGKVLGGRDHTTILYSRDKVDEMCRINDKIAKDVDDIKNIILKK